MPAANHGSMGTSRRNCPRAAARENSQAAHITGVVFPFPFEFANRFPKCPLNHLVPPVPTVRRDRASERDIAGAGCKSRLLARLSQFKAVFGSSARKFLLLSTSPPPKLAETGQVKTLPLF